MADSMDVDVAATAGAPGGLTILRIKRKRDAEQLEALVIDPARRKRVRPSTGLFTYAGTLEEGADLDAIQKELSALQQQSTQTSDAAPVNPAPTERLIAPRPSRKYTVVRSKSDAAAPVQTASATNQVTVYDAVPDDAPLDAEDAPEELKHFLPMLESYLQSHAEVSLLERPGEPGDYVYDVYVHRAGLQSAAAYTAVGSVSGLPGALEDAWDSDEDALAGDTEDEDSNDEDFYRNDYPDERSDDSASDAFSDGDGEGEYIEDPEAYAAEHDDDGEDGRQPEMHKFAGRNAVAYW